MAQVFPFQPYRYTPKAGPIEKLTTQPYDKISPAMQAKYLSANPNNLVKLILGERFDTDTESNNVYTRAAALLRNWLADGIIARDPEPGLYAYFQLFADPDSGEARTRKGFIGAGQLEEYSANIIHRHEQTLSGPKKDRLELMRHTQTHLEQIFLLYPDKEGAIDRILDQAAQSRPDAEVADEYGVTHKMWKICDPAKIERVQALMADKKLVIADGHHRYETALGYSKESPKQDAKRMMMTFVNMHADGLRILATHRVVRRLEGFDAAVLKGKLSRLGKLAMVPSVDEFKKQFARPDPSKIRVGIAVNGDPAIWLLEADRPAGGLDVIFLHGQILGEALGIGEEAVRDEKYITYVRGVDAAWDEVKNGAQLAFLLQPTTVEQVAEVSFSGGVMPQKSTDFYPKLLSGLTIYPIEK